MDINDYIEQKNNIQTDFLGYLDNIEENEYKDYYLNLLVDLENDETLQDKRELKLLIRFISIISNNHHRCPGFFDKINKILLLLKDRLKQNFTNSEIFDIFQNNKRILLFLIENDMITLDEPLLYILKLPKYQLKNQNYIDFFKPEFDKFDDIFDEDDYEDYEVFIQNRRIGENESYICQLIRKDDVENFISYCSQKNNSLDMKIEPSIFETNQFFINRIPTLIEYSAFFGSLQILMYLFNSGVELKSSIWPFAIHGNNPDVIHFLEDKHIQPKNASYDECVVELIKCHHNNIYNYIIDNFYQNKNEKDPKSLYFYTKSIKFVNFEAMPENWLIPSVLYDLCQYDYVNLVKLIFEFVKNEDSVKKNEFETKICQQIILNFCVFLNEVFKMK